MDQWKHWCLLLLPLSLCLDTEETIVKTIESKQDVTPVCTSATVHYITMMICKISTQRSRGPACRLLYHHGHDFENECDSRFTLLIENQTIFLHLTNLTPEDSGNYTCECSHIKGTDVLHLSITVKGGDDTSTMTKLCLTKVICCATTIIIVTGVVLGNIIRKNHFRNHSKPGPGLSVHEIPCSLDKDDPGDPYMGLLLSDHDIYQNISSLHHQHDTKTNSARNISVSVYLEQEANRRDTGQNCEIYENI